MSPKRKRIPPMIVGCLVASLCGAVGSAGAVSLNTDPPRSSVMIEGKLAVSGTAPIPLDAIPSGSYRLKVSGPGSFNSISRMAYDPAQGKLSVHAYSGAVSLLYPPGLGFRRQGSNFRGSIFFLSSVSGIAGWFEAALDIQNAEDDVAFAQSAYDNATTEIEAALAREALVFNTDILNDEKQMRNLWLGYTAYWWLGAAVETWLLTPKPELSGGGENYTLIAPQASGAGAALRSALVPGSGQRFLGNEGRGNLYAGSVALFGAGGLIAHNSYLQAKREQDRAQRLYDAAQTPETSVQLFVHLVDAQNTTRDKDRVRLALFGATALVYVWNIIDAAVMGQDKADLTRLTWNVLPTSDGLMAGMTWRIS